MVLLHASVLDVDLVRDTLNVLLKFEADIEAASKQIAGLTHKARQDAGVRLMSDVLPDVGALPCGRRLGTPLASEPLRRFLQVARGAGLRVSAAEGIDAARAVDLVGFADRTVLKDTLGLRAGEDTGRERSFTTRPSSFISSETNSPAMIERRRAPAAEQDAAARPVGSGGEGMGGPGGQSLGQLLLRATTARRWRPRWNRRRGRPASRTSASSRRRTCMPAASWTAWACAQAGTRHRGDAPDRHAGGLGRAQFLEGKVEATARRGA